MEMADLNTLWMIVKLIVIATFAAGFRAFIGYAKNRQNELFDHEKALVTVLLGAFLGFIVAVATVLGFTATQETVNDILGSFGLLGFLTAEIEDAAKAVVRWFRARLAA